MDETTNTQLKTQIEELTHYLTSPATRETPGIVGDMAAVKAEIVDVKLEVRRLNGAVAQNCEVIEQAREEREALRSTVTGHGEQLAEMRGRSEEARQRDAETRATTRERLNGLAGRVWHVAKVAFPAAALAALVADRFL